MTEDDRKTPESLSETKLSSTYNLPKPFLLCVAFVAGLFVASVTFNLVIYFSLRSKYDAISVSGALQAATSGPKFPSTAMAAHPPGKFGDEAAVDIYNNIVMIQVRFATYNRCMPWQTLRATFQPGLAMSSMADASGLILEHGLILTSAYVATDTYLVTVMRQGEPRQFEAEVVGVARELDIALLSVKDPAFWRETDITVKLEAAKEILGRGNRVTVAGFPVGQDLSISKVAARISRVEAQAAGYAGRYGSFPTAVLDLYPKIGSDVTVGPVFQEKTNELVGFMGRGDTVVPIRTIAAFLKAYRKDPSTGGTGMLGMIYRPMQPLALRKYWDMPMDNVGVQIRSVDPASELYGKVQRGDILVAIDGEAILANGAVSYRRSVDNLGQINDVALPFSVLLADKSLNETAKLSFRQATEIPNDADGRIGYKVSKSFDVEVKMKRLNPLTPRTLDQKGSDPPTYFLLGGFVFTVFTEDLVLQSKQMGVHIPLATQADAMHRWRKSPDEQIIVLLKILDHPCNKWYSTGAVRILTYFNGQEVVNMKQFVSSVSAALSEPGQLLKFTFGALDDADTAGGPDDPDVVLDTAVCAGADKELSMKHLISAPASPDLKDVYKTLPEHFTQMSKGFEDGKPSTPVHIQQKKKLNPQQSSNPSDVSSPQNASHASMKNIPWTNVVQIRLQAAEPHFLSPWKMQSSQGSRCSAIIVDKSKKMILTNSHCVANAMSLDILREDVPIPVPARVVEIAHDVDLAWITTDSEEFWASEKIKPVVSMGEGLPYISHSVRVVGYPKGGASICITQGIVSRVDGETYPNGLMSNARNTPSDLLIVQVDAAINPGNSGGPVFDENGNLVGLAFAGMFGGVQNVGYVIPNVHLRNFVTAIKESSDHRWKAQSETGIKWKRVENPALRKFLQLKEGETGVQVRSVAPGSPLAHKGIVKGNVMLKIDGLDVEGNGKVLRDLNGKMVTLPFETIVTEKKQGDSTKLEFLQVNTETGDRSIKAIDVVFTPVAPLVPRFYDAPAPVKGREHFAAKPTYFIKWGLVWGVFSNPVYAMAQAVKKDVPWTVTKAALHRWRQDDTEEVVVLLQGLGGSACTLNYDTETMRILKYFNGKKVSNIRDLVKYSIDHEANAEEFMRITFAPLADEDTAGTEKDPDIVLHRKFCGNDQQLLQANNIPQQASPDIIAYLEELTNQATAQSHSLLESQSHEKAIEKATQRHNIMGMPATNEKLQWSTPVIDAMAMSTTDAFADAAAQPSRFARSKFEQASVLEDDGEGVATDAQTKGSDTEEDAQLLAQMERLHSVSPRFLKRVPF